MDFSHSTRSRQHRRLNIAVAAVAAATLALPAATASAGSTTTLVVGGTTFPTMGQDLMKLLTNTFSPNLVNVPYPAQLWPATKGMPLGPSMTAGAATLLDMINSHVAAGASVYVWGISQGALVADLVQRALLFDPVAPTPSVLTFVRVADPSNPINGVLSRVPGLLLSDLLDVDSSVRVAPESQYNTVVITNEFDGFADFPDRPSNFVAVLNAVIGLWYRHGQTAITDLSTVPATNVSVTVNSLGATTTTYLAPSPILPITQILRDAGVPASIVDPLERVLRPIVEAGYARYDTVSASRPEAKASTSVAPPPADSSGPLVAPQQAIAGPEAAPQRPQAPEIRDIATSHRSWPRQRPVKAPSVATTGKNGAGSAATGGVTSRGYGRANTR